ncbi:MAG: tRNA (guanosine(37)-N1)-methyltransferase TrmD [Spirochaetes bacterium]|nr:tRNA (guanosine(37)-N1)-methyltransferase TrmD [Spirochaetota bacterium]
MKIFKIITLFPEFFQSPLQTGLLGKAVEKGLCQFDIINLREFGEGHYRQCDDYPYGGGSGMVLMPGPLCKAIKQHKGNAIVIYPSPSGTVLTQALVKKLFEYDSYCFICGQYEGIDQRIIDRYVDYEISIGDYILSGGEFATLVIIDALCRYIPGFMSNPQSLSEESFENYLLEYPQYTRPRQIDGMQVPDILLSGNHEKIRQWRLEKSIEKTKAVRPDLYRLYLAKKDEVEQ